MDKPLNRDMMRKLRLDLHSLLLKHNMQFLNLLRELHALEPVWLQLLKLGTKASCLLRECCQLQLQSGGLFAGCYNALLLLFTKFL